MRLSHDSNRKNVAGEFLIKAISTIHFPVNVSLGLIQKEQEERETTKESFSSKAMLTVLLLKTWSDILGGRRTIL